jgi:tight adherence protein C
MAETSRGILTGYPDLAEELNQVCLELKAGSSRSDVLWGLAERSGDVEVRKLVVLLIDTDRFGTSLAPALRSHAKYLRTRRRQKAQETARKLSVKLVFPVFFLIFPSILLVTLGPAVIAVFSQLVPMLTGAQ